MFHGLFTFSGWLGKPEKNKNKVHHETIYITKIIMIAKYLEYASVHSQLANSAFLSHTLSCLHSWQQQLLNFDKYLATHTMNLPAASNIFASHDNDHVIYNYIWDLEKVTQLNLCNIKLRPYWIYCHPVSNIAELLKENRFCMWQLFYL